MKFQDQYTDREHLTSRMYATKEPLQVRIETHKLYTRPQMDFVPWVLDHIPWQGDKVVLDIGCGSGNYVEPVNKRLKDGVLLLGDLSFGMLQDLRASSPQVDMLINSDAMHLPLPGMSCDVVLANHMLYHVPDMDRALAEARRVLRPGGFLLAATNSRFSMRGFVQLVQSAAQALGHHLDIPESPVLIKFNLENGLPLIQAVFPDTSLFKFDANLVFPSPQPVIDYVNSLSHTYETLLPEELTWDALLGEVERQVASTVAARGEYIVPKTTGLFVAKRGNEMD